MYRAISLLSLPYIPIRNRRFENQIPLLTVFTLFHYLFPKEWRMCSCHRLVNQRPVVVHVEPSFLQQVLQKSHRVSNVFRDSKTGTHQVHSLLQEVHVRDTFIPHLPRMPPQLPHSIFSLGHPRLEHLLNTGRLPHHTAEMNPLYLRNIRIHTEITSNQQSAQEHRHVFALVHACFLDKTRREPKRLYTIFIYRGISNFFRE